MRRKLIIANLKMHFNSHDASIYIYNLEKVMTPKRSVEVVVAPSLISLQSLSLQVDHRRIKLAAQNAYYEDQGAYTGEVSFNMLKGLCNYVIIGHSERRIYFHEDNKVIAKKIQAAFRNDITPILCVGENITERRAGHASRVIHDQLTSAVSNLTANEISKLVIAYEPVWAISTFGNIKASPVDVNKMLLIIRAQISEIYGETVSESMRVIYGGSVDSNNVGAYLDLESCDGSLVGGASLNYLEFNKIIQRAV